MNYLNIYENLIKKAIKRNWTRNNHYYLEKHHIIPKCIGGLDKPHNTVFLTAKEHFIAHLLLHKEFPEDNRLFYSVNHFRKQTPTNFGRTNIINSRRYEYLKKEFSKRQSNLLKGTSRPDIKGTNHPNYNGKLETDEVRLKKSLTKIGQNNPSFGKKCPQETKEKIRKAHLGKQRPEHSEFMKKQTKKYHIIDSNGSYFVKNIEGLKEFSKYTNINIGSLSSKVNKGKINTSPYQGKLRYWNGYYFISTYYKI